MRTIQIVYAATLIAKILGVDSVASWPWWALLLPFALWAAVVALSIAALAYVRLTETPEERNNREAVEALEALAEGLKRERRAWGGK